MRKLVRITIIARERDDMKKAQSKRIENEHDDEGEEEEEAGGKIWYNFFYCYYYSK